MILTTKPQRSRSGATAVELAAVIVVFALLLFGILEYCLIVYTYNVTENAVREGVRFAVVRSNDAALVADTKDVVKKFMFGLDTKMKGYACDVYLADSSGANLGDPTAAKFGQYVCVDVKLDYTPLTPGLLHLKKFTIRSRISMGSESN